MPYVMRGSDGKIKAASPSEIDLEGWEFVEGSSKSYIDFLEAALAEQDPFRESDIHLARVLEDLISLLTERDIIRFTDLPSAAQKRLIYRQTLRQQSQILDIIDEDSCPIPSV